MVSVSLRYRMIGDILVLWQTCDGGKGGMYVVFKLEGLEWG